MKISPIAGAVIVFGGFLLSACAGDRQGELAAGGVQALPNRQNLSWMSPATKTAQMLVYLADWQEVDVYDYASHALVGQLMIAGANTLCSDKSGNIWVSTANRNGSQMLEYARGGTQPIAELFSYPPHGCAVYPKSGDLAVVTSGDARGNQNLEIYHQGRGLPHTYSYHAIKYWYYCAYDANGNLLIQGNSSARSNPIAYAELQSGHTKPIPVNISTTDAQAAGVQWDGKYFLVGYIYDNVMHRYSVHNGQATEIGQIQLQTAGQLHLYEFWLHYQTLLAVTSYLGSGNDTLGGFPYPAGSPEEHVYTLDDYPSAITATAKQ